jgi:phosphoribosylaminoimidazolecarboxamide formyltransferase/IMP cyclohydrolase
MTPSFPPPPDRLPVRRALISVSDKTGLLEAGRRLAALGVELVSTGGTRAALAAAGLAVRDVAELTGFPEMMDGRVKTLHPLVHGGLLGVRNAPAHAEAMERHGIGGIDLLWVDLYPFEKTVAGGAGFDAAVEQIDIGGPAMIRSSAKNHGFVAVCTALADVEAVLGALEADGGTGLELRRRLAAAAFARTAAYDAAISGWFAGQVGEAQPARKAIAGSLVEALRYGENPHQSAAFYRTGETRPGVATARQVQGKALSYNNIADTDAAFELIAEWDPAETAAVAIIKHANPCGAALGGDVLEAHRRALQCDPVSAFGGIVASNRPLDRAAAEAVVETFTEVVIAPDADEGALAVFAGKKNLRLLLTGALPDPRAPGEVFRSVAGGFLVQGRDDARITAADLKIVTRRQPDPGGDGRHAVRLHRGQAREVQRHRLRPRRPDSGRGRRPDEPQGQRPHRRAPRRRLRPGPVRLRLRVRGLLPLRRWPARGGGRGGHGGDPAGRLGARRGGDRRRRRGRDRHGLHWRAGVPPLAGPRPPSSGRSWSRTSRSMGRRTTCAARRC